MIETTRFTFKKSGADVSASLLFLEKRKHSAAIPNNKDEYDFHVGMVTSVGWSVGDKRAERLYAREPETGALVLDENNDPVPDSDFAAVLGDLYRSQATAHFEWLLGGRDVQDGEKGWSVGITEIMSDRDLVLDPKRLNRKFYETRAAIFGKKHFKVGDVVDITPEGNGKYEPRDVFRYVEIGDIWEGGYSARATRVAASKPSPT